MGPTNGIDLERRILQDTLLTDKEKERRRRIRRRKRRGKEERDRKREKRTKRVKDKEKQRIITHISESMAIKNNEMYKK